MWELFLRDMPQALGILREYGGLLKVVGFTLNDACLLLSRFDIESQRFAVTADNMRTVASLIPPLAADDPQGARASLLLGQAISGVLCSWR
jgi:hypothetical protein